MKFVDAEATRGHDPAAEIWVGVRIQGTEVAERAEVIRKSLLAAGHQAVAPISVSTADLVTVHDLELVDFLREAWSDWEQSSYPEEPGQDRVVPYVFPLAGVTSGRPPRRPASVAARAGVICMDTMTLIGPGTWEAVEAAAACALTAADMVAQGDRFVYALSRPPGHHAGRSYYGGSCYLNNAALAASRLARGVGGVVAVIDLDAHHGNGTQEIFYQRSDIRYGSVHIDPGAGYFPHFLGFADETGSGEGAGANLNLPLPPRVGDEQWLGAVQRLLDFASGVDALVVSLGVDAWRNDPESPLLVTEEGFAAAGRLVGALSLPTVVIQEGGYDLAALGPLVATFLKGMEDATQS